MCEENIWFNKNAWNEIKDLRDQPTKNLFPPDVPINVSPQLTSFCSDNRASMFSMSTNELWISLQRDKRSGQHQRGVLRLCSTSTIGPQCFSLTCSRCRTSSEACTAGWCRFQTGRSLQPDTYRRQWCSFVSHQNYMHNSCFLIYL